VHIKPMIHEVRIRNQVIYLDPPVEIARQEWLFQFEDVLGAWTGLGIASRG
jgi:dynein heavy chain 1